MITASVQTSAAEKAVETLRRAGNPFRNCFARNPDDDVCARYHVPELFAVERDQLLGIVDLYRQEPKAHSEVIPVLGNKGAGKTHLLHTIKHGPEGGRQLLVTPGVYQRDSDFLEYLLFQVIDTLLGGGCQKGTRPLEFVGAELTRRALSRAVQALSPDDRIDLFPAEGIQKLARRLGFGTRTALDQANGLIAALTPPAAGAMVAAPLNDVIRDAGLPPARAFELVQDHINHVEPHNTQGLMRRSILTGFAKAILLGDESEIALFLTNGFAELPFNVRPTRQDLVLAVLKSLMELLGQLRLPVVVAFDQLEDLLLARRSDDAHKVAESFFAGIVQAMHHIDGLCFLVFAERGLWNRFVPSLDGYIQDRLNNPIHLPRFGTITAIRLEAPTPELVRQVTEARLKPTRDGRFDGLEPSFPFNDEQITRIAKTEPTLRDMLQQFRNLFDKLVFDHEEARWYTTEPCDSPSRIPVEHPEIVKSLSVIQVDDTDSAPPGNEQPVSLESVPVSEVTIMELWDQEQRSARRRLEPEGALPAAARELQAGLGAFLQICNEHGVKVGPWRLQHVVPEWSFGDHPTYGVVTIAHWACKDGPPWKVGIGLFLARSGGKPKDLEVKLSTMDAEPPMLDHLILLRPEDDMGLSGKSRSLWQAAEKRGHHARLEPLSLDAFARLASFPRWLAALTESLPEGQPLPNIADVIQDACEQLLEQLCMPIQQS